MRTNFENKESIILVFFKNCSYYLYLVFSVFSMFFRTKENWNQTFSSRFHYSPYFLKHKTVLKNRNQIGLTLFILFLVFVLVHLSGGG